MTTPKGGEYWMARDLQGPLGYSRWESFEEVIARARMACDSTGEDPDNHIRQVPKKVAIGSGAVRERRDFSVKKDQNNSSCLSLSSAILQ